MDFKKFLCERGLGQTEFSRKTGIPLRTVQNWCGGQREPSDWTIRMIEFYLDNIDNPNVYIKK